VRERTETPPLATPDDAADDSNASRRRVKPVKTRPSFAASSSSDMSRFTRGRAPKEALKLTIDMFRPNATGASKSRKAAVALADRLVRGGVIETPGWYDAASRVGPSPRPMRARKPKELTYAEDALSRAYYKRDPTAAFDPIDCESTRTHYVTAFARRQLEVMRERKMNEREALTVVEREQADERKRFAEARREGAPISDDERVLTPSASDRDVEHGSLIEAIQAEEEARWKEHVEALKVKVGETAEEASLRVAADRAPRRRK